MGKYRKKRLQSMSNHVRRAMRTHFRPSPLSSLAETQKHVESNRVGCIMPSPFQAFLLPQNNKYLYLRCFTRLEIFKMVGKVVSCIGGCSGVCCYHCYKVFKLGLGFAGANARVPGIAFARSSVNWEVLNARGQTYLTWLS